MAAAETRPKALTQAEFARAMGWNRSTVTRLKQAGRLVVDAHGHVLAAESVLRIEETGGMRFDVAARHAASRAAAMGECQPAEENRATAAETPAPEETAQPPATKYGNETRVDAQARKESAAADLLEIELAQKRGNLIPKEDVDAALRAFAAATRARLDVLADQLAPVLAPVTDMNETHAVLAEHCRGVLAGIADEMHRAEAAAGQGGT